MQPFETLTSKTVPLRVDNVDTDQIIPARYLTTVSREGLGDGLFDAFRYENGEPNPEFIMNRPERQGAQILIAGDNFGCGSSREHAVWALADYGFRAVIAASFADIFRNNSLKNGLLPIQLEPEQVEALWSASESNPESTLTINLAEQQVKLGSESFSFSISAFRKDCILKGLDDLGYLLNKLPAIREYEMV